MSKIKSNLGKDQRAGGGARDRKGYVDTGQEGQPGAAGEIGHPGEADFVAECNRGPVRRTDQEDQRAGGGARDRKGYVDTGQEGQPGAAGEIGHPGEADFVAECNRGPVRRTDQEDQRAGGGARDRKGYVDTGQEGQPGAAGEIGHPGEADFVAECNRGPVRRTDQEDQRAGGGARDRKGYVDTGQEGQPGAAGEIGHPGEADFVAECNRGPVRRTDQEDQRAGGGARDRKGYVDTGQEGQPGAAGEIGHPGEADFVAECNRGPVRRTDQEDQRAGGGARDRKGYVDTGQEGQPGAAGEIGHPGEADFVAECNRGPVRRTDQEDQRAGGGARDRKGYVDTGQEGQPGAAGEIGHPGEADFVAECNRGPVRRTDQEDQRAGGGARDRKGYVDTGQEGQPGAAGEIGHPGEADFVAECNRGPVRRTDQEDQRAGGGARDRKGYVDTGQEGQPGAAGEIGHPGEADFVAECNRGPVRRTDQEDQRAGGGARDRKGYVDTGQEGQPGAAGEIGHPGEADFVAECNRGPVRRTDQEDQRAGGGARDRKGYVDTAFYLNLFSRNLTTVLVPF